jgi:hypothetical protein
LRTRQNSTLFPNRPLRLNTRSRAHVVSHLFIPLCLAHLASCISIHFCYTAPPACDAFGFLLLASCCWPATLLLLPLPRLKTHPLSFTLPPQPFFLWSIPTTIDCIPDKLGHTNWLIHILLDLHFDCWFSASKFNSHFLETTTIAYPFQ